MKGLPPGWALATLGEVASSQLGKMLSAKAKTGVNPRPYLRNRNVQWGRFDLDDVAEMDFSEEELERFEVRPGDLMVCEGGEVGRAAIWRGQIAPIGYQKALHRLRPRSDIQSEFLLYQLMQLTQSHGFDRFVTGSTIKHLPQEDLRELPMVIPPLNEQQRIVAAIEEQFSRLDATDASLVAARRRLELLRRAILVAATCADWPTVTLGEAAGSMRYGTSMKCLGEADGPPVLRIPNVRSGRVDLTDLKFSTVPAADLGDCLVLNGDLLFVRTNGSRDLIGRVGAVIQHGGMAFASYLIRARPHPDMLDPRWAVLALSAPAARSDIESKAATTAGQYNLNLQALRSLVLPLPPLPEQRRIVTEVERQLSLIDAMRGAIDTAQRRGAGLRRAILDRAFRGELVPQDLSDEPASVLLERIRAARVSTAPSPRRRGAVGQVERGR